MQQVVGEQRQRRVTFVPHARVDNAAGEQRSRLDEVLVRVEVLVDLSQATVHVPEKNEAERCHGAHHTCKGSGFGQGSLVNRGTVRGHTDQEWQHEGCATDLVDAGALHGDRNLEA